MSDLHYIIIAHHDLDRKISKEECIDAVDDEVRQNCTFIDFEVGETKLSDLYSAPFDNIALLQQRKYQDEVLPLLRNNPNSHIIYFGLTSIPVSFYLGTLVGNTYPYTIYQFHHSKKEWVNNVEKPRKDYSFSVLKPILPTEIQKGKGDVVIRVATSYNIDKQSTYEVVPNPSNEFDIELSEPHIDSLYDQKNIQEVVEIFQDVLNCYANKLTDRDKIHLFIASSSGLPFVLGTRINSNIYPLIQTYQFSRHEVPKYKNAILVSRELNNVLPLSESDRKVSQNIRLQWSRQLEKNVKPYITAVTGKKHKDFLDVISNNDVEYKDIKKHLKYPWNLVPSIDKTSLSIDMINMELVDVGDGFEYKDKSNAWCLDDGFLIGLNRRLEKKAPTNIMQAGRLFLFHEALHMSKHGHWLTKEIASGIGQFPKVIEEADYQADVWGLLSEYKYSRMYEPERFDIGIKDFFCNSIDTAVETMWSFVDTGQELSTIQVRSMNRFLNWYWQWVLIEKISGQGTLSDVISILFDKPVIELGGAPMQLEGYRTFYKLNYCNGHRFQLAAFFKNRVYRFAPNQIEDIIDGFKTLNGDKIKAGLKSFHATIGQQS